ncbi:MAG TPA: TonB-dependent receptor plug domain-containing protein, partial [Thermoanaerobaculia bacterium]|nr:TonB-dependent receptor plug domain-containing protein [Thermoanaerobaculia bacterium]
MIAHEGEHEGQHEARRRGPRRTLDALFLVLAALVVAAAVPALAQETEDEPETAAEAEGSEPILDAQQGEVITVTARKREENLQEVPLAVTVTPGEVLEDTSAPDISVLQSYVPNLAVYAGRNQSTTLTVFLRGIGQADPLWGVDPGVGLYLDEVYVARPQGALLDVYDIDRVEVLRGPQGTLYGKNTIGGAIKYVSR